MDCRIWKSATDIFDPLREPLHYLGAQTLVVFIVRCQQKTTESMLISRPQRWDLVSFFLPHLKPGFSLPLRLSFFCPSLPFYFSFNSSTVSIPSQSRDSRDLSNPRSTQSSALSLSKGNLILHCHRLKRLKPRSFSSPDNEVCNSTLARHTPSTRSICAVGAQEAKRSP